MAFVLQCAVCVHGNVPTRRFRVKIRAILPFMALAAFSFAPVAMAQAGAPPTKFKVMDMRAAIVNTAEAKAAYAQLQSQFASQNANIESIQKQIDDISKRLQAGANTLSQEEQAKLNRQGQMLQNQLKRAGEQLDEQSQAAQADVVDNIGRKMMDIVETYAKENGLDCVLNSSNDSIAQRSLQGFQPRRHAGNRQTLRSEISREGRSGSTSGNQADNANDSGSEETRRRKVDLVFRYKGSFDTKYRLER